jgi:hypothetical protein
MNIKRHEMQVERGYRALCLAAKELMRSLHRTAMKEASSYLKKSGGYRSQYNFENMVRSQMGDTKTTRFLGPALFETIAKIQSYREKRRSFNEWTTLQRRYHDAATELRNIITQHRPNTTPDMSPGMSTKVLDHAIGSHRYWSPKIQLSPAWLRTVNKLGSATVSKSRVVLSARYSFRVDDNTTVHAAEVLDIKSRSTKKGWIVRWENGGEITLKFGEHLDGTISRMRTEIMNTVMEEMRLL